MTVGETLARVGRSPRTAIGAAAGLDLSVRVVELRPVADAVGTVLVPVVSIASGTLVGDVVGTATTWLLFAVAFYVVAPRVYPSVARPAVGSRTFRVAFAMGGAGFGLVLAGGTDGSLVVRSGHLFGVVLLVAASLSTVLVRAGWRLVDPDGEGVALVDAVVTADFAEERRRDRARGGVVARIADALTAVAVGLFLCVPCFVVAVLALVLLYAYPLPDLLAVAYVLGAPALARRKVDLPFEDAEERLLALGRGSARGIKGMALTVLSGVGAVTVALVLWVAIGQTAGFLRVATTAATVAPVTAWLALGFLCCFYGAAAYAVWAWIRELRRLPAFVARWRTEADQSRPPVGRAPLTVVPSMVALVAGVLCLAALDGADRTVAAVAWPLAFVVLLAGVAIGRRRRRGTVDHEDHVVVGSLVVQLAVTWTATDTTGGLLAVADRGVSDLPTVLVRGFLDPAVLASVVLVVGGGYLGDVVRIGDRHDDHRRYVPVAYLFGLSAGLALVGIEARATYANGFLLFAGVVLLGGLGLLLADWYDRRDP